MKRLIIPAPYRVKRTLHFEDLLELFGDQVGIAEYFSVTASAVSMWIRDGVLPAERAIELEFRTNGRLRAVQLPTKVRADQAA